MQDTKLIVLRGPSGSGKSSVAQSVRAAQGQPTAIVGQDYLRRMVLKEKDIPNGLNIELIKRTTLFLLGHSYHVVMEGIFDSERYEQMFQEIIKEHPDSNYFFYFDISLEETLRRHQHKPNKEDFGEKEMRSWYKEKDPLEFVQEDVIPEHYRLEQAVKYVGKMSGLR